MQIAITTLIAIILALLGSIWLADPATRTQGAVLVGGAMVLVVYSFTRVESVWPRPMRGAVALRRRTGTQRRIGLVLMMGAALMVLWSLLDIWSGPFEWGQAARWMLGLVAGVVGAYLVGGEIEVGRLKSESPELMTAPFSSSIPASQTSRESRIQKPQGIVGPRPAGYKLEAIGKQEPLPEDLAFEGRLPANYGATINTASRTASVFEPKITRGLEVALVIAILLIGIWLRVYNIDQMPPGIFVDETNAALDGLRILDGDPKSLFGVGWFETPNGFVYLQTIFFRLLGTTFFSIKLQSLLPGILTVLATYLLAKEMFGIRAGLFAAAFIAFNRWHFNMSRWGWNEVYPPLMQVLALYFIQRAARLRSLGDWAMAGFVLGLGMYTYLAIRLAVVAVGLYLVYRVLVERGFLRRNWQGLILFSLIYLMTLAPLGFTYYKNPFTFLNRSQQVSIFHDIEEAQGDLQPLWTSVSKHVQMFHVNGDSNPRHNLPGEPMLDPVTGAFFLLGLAWSLWRWRDHKHGLLWIWIAVTLLGGIFSRLDEAPQGYRTLAAVPALVILAADAYDLSLRGLIYRARRYNLWRWLWAILAVSGLVAAGILNYHVYFNRQKEDPSVYVAFSPLETSVAREVVAKRSDHKLFLSPRLYYFAPLRYFAYQPAEPVGVKVGPFQYSPFEELGGGLDRPGYELADPPTDLPLADLDGDNALFLLDYHFQYVLDLFRYYYPGTEAEVIEDRLGRPLYLSVTVPGSEIKALQGSNLGSASASLKGLYIPQSGNYTLTALSADSSIQPQVKLDGSVLANEPVFLGKGLHALELLNLSGDIPADAPVLAWEGPAGNGPVPDRYLFLIPPSGSGLLGTYYQGSDWAAPALMQRVDPLILSAWPEEEPIYGSFSATWTGELLVPSDGFYQFQLNADDGVRFWLDGELQSESLVPDAVNQARAALELSAGPHPIRIDYFQRGGGKSLELFWQPPDQPMQPIAPRYLRPAAE